MSSFLFADREWIPLAHRALWCGSLETLFVADLHLGKGTALRAQGLPVPPGTTHHTLDRLCRLLKALKARRLVVLGDLLHAKTSRDAGVEDAFLAQSWTCEKLLIRGNHDRSAGDPPDAWGFEVLESGTHWNGLVLCHEPPARPQGPWLAGHVHPKIRLHGKGRQSLSVPAFFVSPHSILLPSFGSLTGGVPRLRMRSEQVYACLPTDHLLESARPLQSGRRKTHPASVDEQGIPERG